MYKDTRLDGLSHAIGSTLAWKQQWQVDNYLFGCHHSYLCHPLDCHGHLSLHAKEIIIGYCSYIYLGQEQGNQRSQQGSYVDQWSYGFRAIYEITRDALARGVHQDTLAIESTCLSFLDNKSFAHRTSIQEFIFDSSCSLWRDTHQHSSSIQAHKRDVQGTSWIISSSQDSRLSNWRRSWSSI